MSLIEKTSIRIPSQLPEFVRDDLNYDTFVSFVQAYYEWMELANTANANSTIATTSNEGVVYASHNLENYFDVDRTLDGFYDYFINQFLPNFPQDVLVDKDKLIKFAKQLYQAKGTPASFKLLFRLLYNSDAELQFTRDLVFRASSGEWYVPKYLRLKTSDTNWLSSKIKNLKVFGETSKSFAVIENATTTTKVGTINLYVSQIERLFQSGETIRLVDSANQDVYVKDGAIVSSNTQGAQLLTAKLLGAISSINISPKYRGLKYRAGDPVVVYGGLNDKDGIGATAEIEETTRGSIQRLNIVTGGHGYRVDPNTVITFTGGGGSGAIAHVASVNTNAEVANVTLVGTNIIALAAHLRLDANNYNFSANVAANANASLANSLSFISFATSPIDSIIVDNGGGGYTQVPKIEALSIYNDNLPSQTLWIKDGVIYTTNVTGSTPISSNTHQLASVGILAPIQIENGGHGYQANDKIVFSGGTGVGAYANVTAVTGTGSITEIKYVANYIDNNQYPLGGMGYSNTSLPAVTVSSANVSAANASIYVPGILGVGAVFNAETDRIGAITKIKIIEPGEDYISTPNVSFKVQDLVVTNVSGDLGAVYQGLPIKQGTNPNFNFSANVDSVAILTTTANTNTNIYRVRVYNYLGSAVLNDTITIYGDLNSNVTMKLSQAFDGAPEEVGTYQNGVKIYGNGTARGIARFLEGLILGYGRYLSTIGQPSSYSVLQSKIHNDYTYVLSSDVPISAYRDLLKGLLHPAGMRVLGRALLRNQKSFDFHKHSGQSSIYPLQYWVNYPAGDPYVTVSMNVAGNNLFTNTVYVSSNAFGSLSNTDFIVIQNTTGPKITSRIKQIDTANSLLVLDDDVWLTYPNVAYLWSNTEVNRLQVSEFNRANTPNYNIVNNKNYSNTNNHIEDIVFAGDYLTVAGNTYVVISVDYATNQIRVLDEQGLLAANLTTTIITEQFGANANTDILVGYYVVTTGTEENPVPFTINRKINTSNVFIRKSS